MSDKERSGLTRRGFLKGIGVGAIAAGALPGAVEAREDAAREETGARRVLGPGPVAVELDVNGRRRRLEVEPRTTLLDALREGLGFTGPKKVCDRAACGACTVLLDGHPIYACSELAVAAAGRRVETVEGLAGDGSLSDLQRRFVEFDALQCGYCTPGFVTACEGLLRRADREPTDEELGELLGGNVCRCGTYVGIRKAVRAAWRDRRAAGGQGR